MQVRELGKVFLYTFWTDTFPDSILPTVYIGTER